MQILSVKSQLKAAKSAAADLLNQTKQDAVDQAKRLQSEAKGHAKKLQEAASQDFAVSKNQVVNLVFEKAIGVGEAQLGKLKSLKDRLTS